MGEFDLIRRYFLPVAEKGHHPDLVLALGDDCAIQSVPPDQDLVFSIDTLVEGVHFPAHYYPDYTAWRALAAAASDLAAMGAAPVCFTLALSLPEADEAWLEGFGRGLAQAASRFGLALAGGDTTRGPLTISIQVHGTVAKGQGLTRSGARTNDLVAVSGTLGDAGAALDFLDVPEPGEDGCALLERYHHPQPRLELGQALRGFASACIDISDGLLADLGHILERSAVGATINPELLPLSVPLQHYAGDRAQDLALSSGDDYELCITISEALWERLPAAIKKQLTVIGYIDRGEGIRFTDGKVADSGAQGFDHFGSTS
ncbi:thiamine-phosphate kinase [Marinobacter pelagius]|uniref:thiamine-phosphate kinase n=1 Tax=Marinobacter sp. C7 TaxID=2951363 RepID=UPI001EF105AC|nr:thiamine-phosphate kinase [Marinobacter sp. C7]MCG7201317.1 thiamine-phosphate kinase [Marinobacter sp. C7]